MNQIHQIIHNIQINASFILANLYEIKSIKLFFDIITWTHILIQRILQGRNYAVKCFNITFILEIFLQHFELLVVRVSVYLLHINQQKSNFSVRKGMFSFSVSNQFLFKVKQFWFKLFRILSRIFLCFFSQLRICHWIHQFHLSSLVKYSEFFLANLQKFFRLSFFSLVYDIKLFFIISSISSVSIDDCFHFVIIISNTIAFNFVFYIVIIISFFVFVRCSKFFCFSFFKIWVIKTIHQALTLSFDIYAFFVFCNDNSTNGVSNSNVAHHFTSFSKCFIISNIECFDEYQYSEYDSQSQYCSNKCFFHIFSCLWYKKFDYVSDINVGNI